MKILICALNSKYIHESLAVWYLKTACDSKGFDTQVIEYTINDLKDAILGELYRKNPDVVAFSCYIWNITEVLWISENLKKVLPKVKIILGGPEVSYDAEAIMAGQLHIDAILKGEGEESLPNLLRSIEEHAKPLRVDSLTYRWEGQIYTNPGFGIIEDLNQLASPYCDEMLQRSKDKIVYFESSRGCPFSCSYCLSSTSKGVRYFKLERVKKELLRLANSSVRQIKFVDRTFNAKKDRALEILAFVKEKFSSININFHFEVAADLFDHELLALVQELPRGLVQFEIGVQTTNEVVLKCINRITDIEKVKRNIKFLVACDNMHIHADLIAGLPGEDIRSFERSFNALYSTKPHQLQLGFLKLLKGSRIRSEIQKHAYNYRESAPYEVLSSESISFGEILLLKDMEEVVERLYNSGRFHKTLDYCINYLAKEPFLFYKRLSQYFRANQLFSRGISLRELYEILYNYLVNMLCLEESLVKDLLAFDFLSCDNSGNLPQILRIQVDKDFRNKCHAYLAENIGQYEKYARENALSAKEIIKKVYFHLFEHPLCQEHVFIKRKNVVIFNYLEKDGITSLYGGKEAQNFDLVL